MGAHIVEGEFQSDKYPTTPRGKVPLSVKDPAAQDLLWEYAQRRRKVDVEFSNDLEWALRVAGYAPPAPKDPNKIHCNNQDAGCLPDDGASECTCCCTGCSYWRHPDRLTETR